jgi:hypothetical protein
MTPRKNCMTVYVLSHEILKRQCALLINFSGLSYRRSVLWPVVMRTTRKL